MVAQTTELPNIRKLFLPDRGYIIADCDLAQADAQVVAWEADDDDLKSIFRDPTADLHSENAKAIFGNDAGRNRQLAKAGVHAVNYGAKPRTLATALGVTMREAEHFTNKWFAAHPGIKEWHRRVDYALATTRQVSNRFGNVRYYFDRVEHLLPQALAWVPQSTVALVINRALVEVDARLRDRVEPLMQVHDSLVMQIRKEHFPSVLPDLKACMEIEVPYPDPLIIPVGIEVSEVSWGDVTEYNWERE
jgi:DNA polymerase-1